MAKHEGGGSEALEALAALVRLLEEEERIESFVADPAKALGGRLEALPGPLREAVGSMSHEELRTVAKMCGALKASELTLNLPGGTTVCYF